MSLLQPLGCRLLQPLGCRLLYVGGYSSTAGQSPASVTLFWRSHEVQKYSKFGAESMRDRRNFAN